MIAQNRNPKKKKYQENTNASDKYTKWMINVTLCSTYWRFVAICNFNRFEIQMTYRERFDVDICLNMGFIFNMLDVRGLLSKREVQEHQAGTPEFTPPPPSIAEEFSQSTITYHFFLSSWINLNNWYSAGHNIFSYI